MNELIKINKSEGGKDIVSARELYSFLEVTTDFTTWYKRMFEYGFELNIDYALIRNDELNNQIFKNPNPKTDFALTLDCAKEISMLQRTEKGKQARQYFIAMEKIAINKHQYQLPTNFIDALKALVVSEEAKMLAENKIKELAPKAEIYDNISNSSGLKTIKEVAKILGTGEHRLFKWLKDEKILMKSNIPYQKFIEQGYFEVKSKLIPGLSQNYSQTFITSKGELYLAKIYKNCHNSYLILN
jgi:anti-repressor protein